MICKDLFDIIMHITRQFVSLHSFNLLGQVKTLVSSNQTIDGKKPMIPNDLDVAKDGTIYWSDSSTHSYLQDSLDEFLGEASGRYKMNKLIRFSLICIIYVYMYL